jgi:enoyl-[acyl-carrier protein] reductase II
MVDEDVQIVVTSAGSPGDWPGHLKANGIKVVHVISSVKFARKAEACGADAVVAEGFEAGGHNGREETTTFVLVPLVRQAVSIPVIAAGGIASGRAMLAAEALGADGSQIGSRFAASVESSAHENFKQRIIELDEGETVLTMKQLTPVRLVKNAFYMKVQDAETRGASRDELMEVLGRGRAKKGMFEGDLAEGELEIGQVSAGVRKIQSAKDIVDDLWQEYSLLKKSLCV